MEAIESLYRKKGREAKRRGLDWDLSLLEYQELAGQLCHYCGAKPSNGHRELAYQGLDRVNSAIGYTKDNVVPCCRYCNVLKSAQPPASWFDFLTSVVRSHGGEVPAWWLDYKDEDRPSKAPNFWSRPRGR